MKNIKLTSKRFGMIALLAVLILLLIIGVSMCGKQAKDVPAPETTAETTRPATVPSTAPQPVTTEPPVETTTEATVPPTDPTAVPTTLPKEEEDTEDYGQEAEYMEIPDPGSPENPYVEVVESYPAQVESVYMAAKDTVSYLIDGAAGSVVTIAHGPVTVTIGETVYTPDETGAVTVDLSKLGEDPVMTILNGTATTSSCVVTLNEGIGGAGNPEILTDPDKIPVVLPVNDDNGYHYQWTASTEGTVTLKLEEKPAEEILPAEVLAEATPAETIPEETVPEEEPVVLEILATVGDKTYSMTEAAAGSLSFDVRKDTTVLIQVITLPWTDGTYPAIEETVLWDFQAALGTRENPEALTDIAQIAVTLEENDPDGWHYLWTATKNGQLTLTPDTALTVTATVGETVHQIPEGETELSFRILRDQQVLIQAAAIPVERPVETESPDTTQDTEPALPGTEEPNPDTTVPDAEPPKQETVLVWPAVTGKITGTIVPDPGTPENPEKLESLESVKITLADGDTDGHVYSWQAPLEGTLTLNRSETTGANLEVRIVHNAVTHELTDRQPVVLKLRQGEAVTVSAAVIPDETGACGAAEVLLTGVFEAAPGTSLENPILLEDPEAGITVGMEARQTLYFSGMVQEMNAVIQDANGISIHYEDKTAWGSQTGTAVMEFPGAREDAADAPLVFSVTSKNAKDVTLSFAYPDGHPQNPAALRLGDNKISLKAGDADGYLLNWTAQCNGFLTISMEEKANWRYQVLNLITGAEIVSHHSCEENLKPEETLEVTQGQQLQLRVMTLDPKDPEGLPAGNLLVKASFYDPLLGTEEKPIPLNSDPETKNTVTVPAGETLHYSAEAEGMILSFAGKDVLVRMEKSVYSPEKGKLELQCLGEETLLAIENTSEKDCTCTLTFTYPEGHRENPLTLLPGENTASLSEGNIYGCAFEWTAEAAGQLTITMTQETGWQFLLCNETSGDEGIVHTSQDEPVEPSEMIEVAPGDRILLVVNTFDPEHPLQTPAADVPFTVTFYDPTLGMEENPVWLNLTDEITIPAGQTMYCTAKADGMLLTLQGAGLQVEHNGSEFLPEQNRITFLCRGQGTFGHPVFAITNTSEEDCTYTICFTYPQGHFRAPEELVPGECTAVLTYNTRCGYHYLWTAEADGWLTVEMRSEEDWYYCVANLTQNITGQKHSSSDEEPVLRETIRVTEGDQIRIVVGSEEAQSVSFAVSAEEVADEVQNTEEPA